MWEVAVGETWDAREPVEPSVLIVIRFYHLVAATLGWLLM